MRRERCHRGATNGTKRDARRAVGAHATVGGCSNVGARCNVPLRDDSQCCRRGRCIVGGCRIVVARRVVGGHATIAGCPDVGARCNVPLRDNSQCCRRGTLHCRGMWHCCGTSRGLGTWYRRGRCIFGGCRIVVTRGMVWRIWHRGGVSRCRGTLPRAPTG
jgi:hypothetical protein